MRARGAHRIGIIGWFLMILQTFACASDLAFEDGRYRDRRRHYSIAEPEGEGSEWRRVRAQGTVLAFQGPGGASMSLIEECGLPPAEPRILARQLLIGLEGRKLVEEGPVGEGGSPGWRQRVDAARSGEPVRLETVTRVIGECSYDWILVVPGGLEELESVFDRWWRSFRSGAEEAGVEAEE
jgi:hypothetical protein